MKYLKCIIVIICFISCKKTPTKTNRLDFNKENIIRTNKILPKIVDIYGGRGDDIVYKESLRFQINKKNDSIFYEYKKESNDSVIFTYKKSKLNDSIILFNNESYFLVDTKELSFKKSNIIIYKYLFDLDRWVDEEMELYFSKDHGIIYYKSLAWGGKTIFRNDDIFDVYDTIEKYSYIFKFSKPPIIPLK